MHGKAKEQAEIDGEKEWIETSTVQAMGKDTYGNMTVDGLQKELENDATVEKIRKKIVVTINDSQRMYYIDDNAIFSNMNITIWMCQKMHIKFSMCRKIKMKNCKGLAC